MKIYEQTTLQYLGAETAADGAGWYMVAADMAPTQADALTAYTAEAVGDDWPTVVLNAASSAQAVPAGTWTSYVIEEGFSPAQLATLSNAADGAVTNVTFGEGLSVAAVTLTEYVSRETSEMTAATLSLWDQNGQSFDMAFEHADTAFTFTMWGAQAQTLDAFIADLNETVEVNYHYEGTEGYDFIEVGTQTGGFAKGAGGRDTIIGGDGDDVISIESGEAYGGKGDDQLTGGAGADTLDGGAGRDWVSYSKSKEGVDIDLSQGKGRGGDAEGDTFENIEKITGSQHKDTLVGDAGDNVLKGLYGNDRLKGGEGKDRLDGGAGDDVLIAGNDGDVLIGGHGDDIFDFSRIQDLSEIATDIIKDFKTGRDSIKLSEAHLGDDNVVTAVETTMNGVKGLALTTNVGDTTVNFAFLEGVSSVNVWDFEGDHIPTIDVV